MLNSRNYLLRQNTCATYLFFFFCALNHQITASVITKQFPHIYPLDMHVCILWEEIGVQSCYSLRPCNRGGLTILLMHSLARINSSCEVWIRRRIKPVTRSYSMIFLIIRSLCWTASNFQSTQQGTQVSEMRTGRSGRREALNVNVKYGAMFQYLNLLAVSWDLAFTSERFCKFSIRRCWPIKYSDGLWSSLLLTELFPQAPIYM